MKKILLPFAAIAVITLLFSSCSSFSDLSIVKRHYRNGFYVHKSNTESLTTRSASENNPAAALKETPAVSQPQVTETQQPKEIIAASPVLKNKPQTVSPAKNFFVHSGTSESVAPQLKNEALKQAHRPSQLPAGGDANQVLLVILALLLPPIAVLIFEGASKRFWIDLIIWLLGGGLWFGVGFYGSFLLVLAVVYALLIVLGVI